VQGIINILMLKRLDLQACRCPPRCRIGLPMRGLLITKVVEIYQLVNKEFTYFFGAA